MINYPYTPRNGYHEEYRRDGTISFKGYYHNGIPDGMWENFDKSGRLTFKGIFDDDREISHWVCTPFQNYQGLYMYYL